MKRNLLVKIKTGSFHDERAPGEYKEDPGTWKALGIAPDVEDRLIATLDNQDPKKRAANFIRFLAIKKLTVAMLKTLSAEAQQTIRTEFDEV